LDSFISQAVDSRFFEPTANRSCDVFGARLYGLVGILGEAACGFAFGFGGESRCSSGNLAAKI
jgi:hypothetical protein